MPFTAPVQADLSGVKDFAKDLAGKGIDWGARWLADKAKEYLGIPKSSEAKDGGKAQQTAEAKSDAKTGDVNSVNTATTQNNNKTSAQTGDNHATNKTEVNVYTGSDQGGARSA